MAALAGDDALPKSTSNGVVLLLAESALDKLKLCDYDMDFCYRKNQLPVSKMYFTEPAANASSQWAALVALVSWTISESGTEFKVDKYDDPNTTANKLMLVLKQLGYEADFPVSRLKQSYGEAVCSVLDFLATRLMKAKNVKLGDPVYPETDGFEEAEVDEVADLGASEEVADEAVESEDEDALYSESVRGTGAGADRGAGAGSSSAQAGALGSSQGGFGGGWLGGAARRGPGGAGDESKAQEEDSKKEAGILEGEQSAEFQATWRAELERVAPRLKRDVVASGNEWRAHLQQVKECEATLSQLLPDAKLKLTQINRELSETLERIGSKEAFLGNNFEAAAVEYRKVQEQLKLVQQQHEQRSQVVDKLSAELSEVTEALDGLKGDMDSRGNSMTDTSPLQKVRKALAKLKAEIKDMELRIGVVGHSLLQASLKYAQEARLAKKNGKAEGPASPLNAAAEPF
jgi:estrogen-related receptor beta like 1